MLRIAVRMLLGDPTKWMGVVFGVLVCTFLITHMLSMFHGMMERSYALVTDIPQADVWVMDAAVQYADEPIAMPETALERVRGIEGVAWAVPLHTATLRARLSSGAFQPVLLIGVDDATLLGAPEHIIDNSPWILRQNEMAIVDHTSAGTLLRMPIAPREEKPGFQELDLSGPTRPLRVGDELQINDHRVVVGAFADLGTRFLSKPIVYTTYSRAVAIHPKERNLLSFVLVKAAVGGDSTSLARRITSLTGLRARTALEFCDDTYWYYVETTGVVKRIAMIVGIGVVTGVAVSALLLYLFTNENLRYYAVLKALGASNWLVLLMVTTQAALAGSTGYGLGIGLSTAIGTFAKSDAMPYRIMTSTLIFAACAVLLVGVVSATLSARKVVKLEPAMVFK